MNEIEEGTIKDADDKQNRRGFFKQISKYLIGLTAFIVASLFGLKRDGEVRLGKMQKTQLGLSEAQGACSMAYDCSGGSGKCGMAYNCSGGGGKCGMAYNCSGQ